MYVTWTVSERKMARMKISRPGTTALKSSSGSCWRFWIKGSGRMISALCWRRWERRSTLTWTLPRSSLTRPVGITRHTSPLPMVRKYINQSSYISFLLPSLTIHIPLDVQSETTTNLISLFTWRCVCFLFCFCFCYFRNRHWIFY